MESNVQGKQKTSALGNATEASNTVCDTSAAVPSCPQGTQGLTPQPHQSSKPAWKGVSQALGTQVLCRAPAPGFRAHSSLACSSSIPRGKCLPEAAIRSGLHASLPLLTFSSSL